MEAIWGGGGWGEGEAPESLVSELYRKQSNLQGSTSNPLLPYLSCSLLTVESKLTGSRKPGCSVLSLESSSSPQEDHCYYPPLPLCSEGPERVT